MQVSEIFNTAALARPDRDDHDRDERTNWRSRGRDGRWRHYHRTWDHRRHCWGGYWGW